MFAEFHEHTLFFVVFGLLLAVMEVGFRLGRAHLARRDDGARTHAGILQTGLLGLLALLLGFNFSIASSRFEARKALHQEEVNAIGTTWLRARLLPAPQREEMAGLLRRYVAARLQAGADDPAVDQRMWQLAQDVAASPGAAYATLFIQAHNEMSNVKWKRRAALDNHVPEAVLDVLLAVALGTLGVIAYGYGLAGRRRHVSTAVYALLIALVLATIVDFDRPAEGFIRIGEEGMLRLQHALR